MLPEYFILFDSKVTNNNILHINKCEIIYLYALKIHCVNNKLNIIDKFDYYIIPIIYPILSIYTINNTHVTQEHISNNGHTFQKFIEDFYIFSNNINKQNYKLQLYSYGNHYNIIKFNLILNNIHNKSSKYYIWQNMFFDIKFIFIKYNIDTDKYTSSTLYKYFIENKSNTQNIQVQSHNFETYSLFIALQYLLSK